MRSMTAAEQVDAEVMVRRSERALGQAIRAGQERGEIGSNGQHGEAFRDAESSSARDFFAHNQEMANVYAVTDDVTDAEFDEALDRAQDEQNVSRANVVRKVREVQSADRAHLHGYLADLLESGRPVPCVRRGGHDRGAWTSEDPEEQAYAARLCVGCAGRVRCDAYGLTYPKEQGVYGARTQQERQPRRGRPKHTEGTDR